MKDEEEQGQMNDRGIEIVVSTHQLLLLHLSRFFSLLPSSHRVVTFPLRKWLF